VGRCSSLQWEYRQREQGNVIDGNTLSRETSFCSTMNSTRVIIDFMADLCVTKGTANLNSLNLRGLLQLSFGKIRDALGEIRASADIAREVFFDFQKFLYEKAAA
jgi:hypothetical protein